MTHDTPAVFRMQGHGTPCQHGLLVQRDAEVRGASFESWERVLERLTECGISPLAGLVGEEETDHAYRFDFGGATTTGWVDVGAWGGSAQVQKSYTTAGRKNVQFLVRQTDGVTRGGAGTQCAVSLQPDLTGPPLTRCQESATIGQQSG